MSITRYTSRLLLALSLTTALTLSACSNPEQQLTINKKAAFVHIPSKADDDRLVQLTKNLVTNAEEVLISSKPDSPETLSSARKASLPILPDTDAARSLAKELGAATVRTASASSAAQSKGSNDAKALVLLSSDASAAEEHLFELTGTEFLVTKVDPRSEQAIIDAIHQHPRVIAVLPQAYPSETIYNKATVAGGKYLLFDNQHFLAMYGHPSGPALGVLGEQKPKKSVARVKRLVAKYEATAPDVTFQPSFEIITTIATAGPGPRGDYSGRSKISELRPLIDLAKKEGITVILDLQPGRASMLEQAKHYEELLLEPHVGLALDPEWKLGKNGKPLQRIGHVNAKQINEVSAWLAALTRDNGLPQKMFVLHQFQTQMIRDRKKVRTDHPELATVIHIDGQGPTAAKFNTWNHIRKSAPANVHWGWKNFVDEDVPMLKAAQTWKRVKPHPDLITYQ